MIEYSDQIIISKNDKDINQKDHEKGLESIEFVNLAFCHKKLSK
jgi:hypothetical protein